MGWIRVQVSWLVKPGRVQNCFFWIREVEDDLGEIHEVSLRVTKGKV